MRTRTQIEQEGPIHLSDIQQLGEPPNDPADQPSRPTVKTLVKRIKNASGKRRPLKRIKAGALSTRRP